MKERTRPESPTWAFSILIFVITVLYLPVVVMMMNSVIVQVGDQFVLTLEWYRQIFSDNEILAALRRSFLVATTASLGATVIGTLGAIAITKTYFRFAKTLNTMSFLSLIVPELVFALSLLSWFFILKIQLSLTTVILAHITFSLCFVLMTVTGRLVDLDPTIEDAARDLGASEWRILRDIILPLLGPALAAAFLLSFLLSFDDFLITFYTSGVGSDTLPIRLYVAMKMGLSAKLSALATIMFIFSFVLIFIMLKLRGMKLGDDEMGLEKNIS